MPIKDQIKKSLIKVTGVSEISLDTPEREEFGDYSTNIAMTIFSKIKNQKLKIKNTNQKSKIGEIGHPGEQSGEGSHPSNILYNLTELDGSMSRKPLNSSNSPHELAENIIEELKKDKNLMKIVDTIEVAGPGFINFHLKTDVLLNNMIQIDGEYGQSDLGKGKTVVIDYSAPNIAKPFSVGHLRSTIIGQSLYNIYKFLGYKVIGDNHLGDWGTQFGKLLYMLDEVKGKQDIDSLSINDLEKLYVEFHQRAEKDSDMEIGAREWFKSLEDGDLEARKLWKKCVDISLKEFNRVYEILNVKIDYAYGESTYEEEMKEMVKDFKSGKLKGLSEGEGGAKIIDLAGEGIETPLMFLKADGATTYATRDLACIRFRVRKWNPDIIIYEVGVQQKLHFQQVFSAARLLNLVEDNVVLFHTNHGWYLGHDGKKFSTREGKTVKLDEILVEAIERAKKLGCEDEETAKMVGVGAIKYYDLMRSVQTDVVFDWDKILNMDGNSGPYLQYTYARTCSVLANSKLPPGHGPSRVGDKTQNSKLEKGQNTHIADSLRTTEEQEAVDSSLLAISVNEEEKSLLRLLVYFPEIVQSAAENYAPNLICNYLFDLASKFNTFYNAHKILVEDPLTLDLRLKLVLATGTVLKSGLSLLGIDAPQRM